MMTINRKVNLIPIKRNQVHKRFMLKTIVSTSLRVTLCKPHTSIISQKPSSLTVYKPDPLAMNHEECQNNEIVGKKGIQHPTIAEPTCENKVCDKPCDPSAKPIAIAHATHSDKYPGVPLSKNDLKKENRPQYARFYPPEKRADVSEPETTFNPDQTKELNENKEMRDNVNLYEKFHR